MKHKLSRTRSLPHNHLAPIVVILFVVISSQSVRGAELLPRARRSFNQLISDLGSPSYTDRKHATRMLIKAGRPAFHSILAAMQSQDSEIRSRAAFILTQMAKDDEAIVILLSKESKSKTLAAARSRRIVESSVVQTAQHARIQKRLSMLVDNGRRALKEGDCQSAGDIIGQIDQLTAAINLYEPPSPWVAQTGWRILATKVALFEISMNPRSKFYRRHHKLIAQHLLAAARQKLRAGDFEAARIKAVEAKELDVTYNLFDDRPDLVLNTIHRVETERTSRKR